MRNGDNVIAFPGQGPRRGGRQAPVAELAGAVEAISCYLADLSAELAAGTLTATAVLLGLSAVERRLDKLAAITVVTWPDPGWALRFCDARVRTLARLREAAASLQPEPGGGGPPPPPPAPPHHTPRAGWGGPHASPSGVGPAGRTRGERTTSSARRRVR